MNPIPANEWRLIEPLMGGCTRLLELGNKRNPNGVYKYWFESQGIEHVSVDWNGQDGALNMDLQKPIDWLSLGGLFDVVTNIGTTEHVDDQAGVWRNIHNAIGIGGHLVSITPAPGSWWWHGEWYPTHTFFRRFAGWNGYAIEALGFDYPAAHPDEESRKLVCAVLAKVDDCEFEMADGLFWNEIRPR